MADLSLFEALPIQIEMDCTAQGLELIQLFSPDQFRRGLMNRVGFRLSAGHVHQLTNELLIEIQRCTHRTLPYDYAGIICIDHAYVNCSGMRRGLC